MEADFERYLEDLNIHEEEKRKKELDTRQRIIINAGIGLNWIGDFLGNPNFKWELQEFPVEKIQFTGTGPEWNKILKGKCEGSVIKFRELIKAEPEIKNMFEPHISLGDEPILLRHSEDEGLYKVLDGMHRFMGAVMTGKPTIKAWLPVNEKEHLPVCEPHAIYDLIRGYIRNARDEEGKQQLYYGLKLLCRTYENAPKLLKERFSGQWVAADDVQEVINKVLSEI